MISSQTALEASHRQIVRMVTLSLMVPAAFIAVVLVVTLLIAFSPGAAIFVALMLIFLLGGGTTLASIRQGPLWLAILPVAVALFLAIIVTGALFAEITPYAASFLVVLVLLVSLSSHRRLALSITILCALLGMVMVVALPLSGLQLSLGPMVSLLKMVIIGALVVSIGVVFDRFLAAQNNALAMAERRANDAEAARSEAEAARAELERRSIEQQRLLDLIQSLELPVLSVGRGVLLVPLVGALDSRRFAAIRRHILESVAQQRAHTVILDVTGISALDTVVAQALLDTAQAVRLLGAGTLLSGIRANIAQTLARMEVELESLHTVSDLGQALDLARQQ